MEYHNLVNDYIKAKILALPFCNYPLGNSLLQVLADGDTCIDDIARSIKEVIPQLENDDRAISIAIYVDLWEKMWCLGGYATNEFCVPEPFVQLLSDCGFDSKKIHEISIIYAYLKYLFDDGVESSESRDPLFLKLKEKCKYNGFVCFKLNTDSYINDFLSGLFSKKVDDLLLPGFFLRTYDILQGIKELNRRHAVRMYSIFYQCVSILENTSKLQDLKANILNYFSGFSLLDEDVILIECYTLQLLKLASYINYEERRSVNAQISELCDFEIPVTSSLTNLEYTLSANEKYIKFYLRNKVFLPQVHLGYDASLEELLYKIRLLYQEKNPKEVVHYIDIDVNFHRCLRLATHVFELKNSALNESSSVIYHLCLGNAFICAFALPCYKYLLKRLNFLRGSSLYEEFKVHTKKWNAESLCDYLEYRYYGSSSFEADERRIIYISSALLVALDGNSDIVLLEEQKLLLDILKGEAELTSLLDYLNQKRLDVECFPTDKEDIVDEKEIEDSQRDNKEENSGGITPLEAPTGVDSKRMGKLYDELKKMYKVVNGKDTGIKIGTSKENFLYIFGVKDNAPTKTSKIKWNEYYNSRAGKKGLVNLLVRLGYITQKMEHADDRYYDLINSNFVFSTKEQLCKKDIPKKAGVNPWWKSSHDDDICKLIVRCGIPLMKIDENGESVRDKILEELSKSKS